MGVYRNALAVAAFVALVVLASACTMRTPGAIITVATYTPAVTTTGAPQTTPTHTPSAAWPTPTREAQDWTPIPSATVAPCVGTVTAFSLRVRVGPGIEYAVIDGVSRGMRVQIIGSAGDWLQIVGPPGWVSGNYIARECVPDAIP